MTLNFQLSFEILEYWAHTVDPRNALQLSEFKDDKC